jgi:hypothetical protein
MNFFLQYKDPRWQKRRLEILQRDNFTCTSCGNNSETLNIHHCVPYKKNLKIWEYQDNELTTLCENCHKEISKIINNCKNIITNNCSRGLEISMYIQEIIQLLDNQTPPIYENIVNIIKKKNICNEDLTK